MQKKAPGWGKAIGIIMICLGGLGIFMHIYKMLLPTIFGSFPRVMNDLSRLDQNNPAGELVFNEFNNLMGMTSAHGTMLVTFGLLCMVLTIFYIIGGAKLLTAKPSNYRFAMYALASFIVLNVVGCAYFFLGQTSFIVKGILIYSLIGLVFDITLLIILNSSNKADYGIGVDESMQSFSVDAESDEIL